MFDRIFVNTLESNSQHIELRHMYTTDFIVKQECI